MSRFNNKQLDKKIGNDYYSNVLINLGLKKIYILYNNYYYFGNRDLTDQEEINKKFKRIENDYFQFLEKLYKKYDRKILIIELGTIFTKLQNIHLRNDEVLEKIEIKDNSEVIEDISYSAKAADIMARKIKTLTEIIIIKDNKKLRFRFTNRDYKKLIILLYYYSLYIFYSSKSNLSEKYENGHVDFYIYPNSLEPICTGNMELENSTNINKVQFNYNSGIGNCLNEEFNNSFYQEKGIAYQNHNNILQSLLNSLLSTNKINAKIDKERLIEWIKSNYKDFCTDKFEKECILNKNSFELSEDNLYKNTCKHRLDTTPLIDINEDYYIINQGFLWNSINFWNNVHSIGIVPYANQNGEKDKILQSVDTIIDKISDLLEEDIIKILKEINNKIKIEHNKKTKDIFKNKNIEENEWDIIAIDKKHKIIFDIESKFLSTSMTESGLALDLKKLEGYEKKFEKRITIEQDNMAEFLNFCDADKTFVIIHIMVTSKVVDFNLKSEKRNFLIIHYDGLKEYILNHYYKREL